MDPSNESFTVSLLHSDQQQPFPPKKPKNKNLFKTIIFSALLILVIILIAGSIIIYSSAKKKQEQQQLESIKSLSTSARYYYCHLTPHDELCFSSLSSIINITAFLSNPDMILITALRVAFDELNKTAISITKALAHFPSDSSDDSLVTMKPRLSRCGSLVRDSLSHVNDSLGLLGVQSNMEALTFVEMDTVSARTRAAAGSVGKCLLALENATIGGDMSVVKEVKLGVEKARMHIVNAIWMFKRRDSILSDFYSPLIQIDYYYYNYYCVYGPLVCLYSAGYFFIGMLYFLLWKMK